jgi:hypothetical protein
LSVPRGSVPGDAQTGSRGCCCGTFCPAGSRPADGQVRELPSRRRRFRSTVATGGGRRYVEVEAAVAVGAELRLCLAAAFTCPFDGPFDPERTLSPVTGPRGARCTGVVVCDTLGQVALRTGDESHHCFFCRPGSRHHLLQARHLGNGSCQLPDCSLRRCLGSRR